MLFVPFSTAKVTTANNSTSQGPTINSLKDVDNLINKKRKKIEEENDLRIKRVSRIKSQIMESIREKLSELDDMINT